MMWLAALGLGACAVGWVWACTVGGPFRPMRNEVSEVLQGTFMAGFFAIVVLIALAGA